MPAVLDVAIGTVFVFLLFSLVVSAFNEVVLSFFDQRAKFLRLGLAELLDADNNTDTVRSAIGKSLRYIFSGTGQGWTFLVGSRINQKILETLQAVWRLIVWIGRFVGQVGASILNFFRGNTPPAAPAEAPPAAVNQPAAAAIDRVRDLCDHGLINALSRSDNGAIGIPSYIPSGAFVMALLDLVRQKWADPEAGAAQGAAAPPTLDATVNQLLGLQNLDVLTAAVERLDSGIFRDFLLALIRTPNGTLETFRTSLKALCLVPPLADNAAPALQAAINDLPAGTVRSDLNLLLASTKAADGNPNLGDFRRALESWPMLSDIGACIARLPAGRLRESLRTLLNHAGHDLRAFETSLEAWFNDAMDRVSGWYKRFAQKWMIIIGFGLAATFNVNTLKIVEVLSTSPNLAKAVASQAESYAHSNARPLSAEEAAAAQSAADARRVAARKALAEATEKKDEKAIAAAQKELDAANEDVTDVKFRAAVARLSETGIPVGWSREQLEALGLADRSWTLGKILHAAFDVSNWWRNFGRLTHWLSVHFAVVGALLSGWFLTALAGSLGAPFWFDMLNRIVNIRSAGKAPEEKDTSGKDANAPSLNSLAGR